MNDRRSGKERRAFERVNVVVDTEWADASGARHVGTISDISSLGCYVLCAGSVEDGDAVKIFLPLGSDGMRVEFSGEVANHFLEIGFAARFTDLSEAQADFLQKFIDEARKSS